MNDRVMEGCTSFKSGGIYFRAFWREAGVCRLEMDMASLQASQDETMPPDFVSTFVDRIHDSLEAGKGLCVAKLKLDLSMLTGFERLAVEALNHIPRGRVASYSYLADFIGHSGAFRAVGSAMAKNPLPVIYPCHRVVGKDGHIKGFSAGGGLAAKRILLMNERVAMRDALHVDMGYMLG